MMSAEEHHDFWASPPWRRLCFSLCVWMYFKQGSLAGDQWR